MEDYIKSKLNTKVLQKLRSTSGCINDGTVYRTDGRKVFVKCNSSPGACVMFEGEYESLKELRKTETVRVPEPFLVGNVGKDFFIVMEYLDMKSLNKHSSTLGISLAEMHLHNIKLLNEAQKSEGSVTSTEVPCIEKFGFHVPTACGYIPQSNEWSDDWVRFYAAKLQKQVDIILKSGGSREISQLWSQLQLKIPSFFEGLPLQPSLLHGDLWTGNCGETKEEPVIFDPASFYGHHEYDLAIAAMFGGFGKGFFDSYHGLIPKAPGFEQRHQLYLLFHHLNHWNHFGSHRESSLQIMSKLLKN